MKRSDQFALGLVGLFAIGVVVASAQVITNPPIAVPIGCAYNTAPVTLTNGQAGWVQCNSTGSLLVAASFAPSGTQDVNLTQVGGAAVSLGQAAMAASIPVAIASNQGNVPVSLASGAQVSGSQAIGITPTDRTVTSATGSSQTVMSALATRKSLTIVNTGNANCGINPTGGTAAIGGAGTITLTPTGSYSPRIPTLAAVTAICTAGQPLYAEES